MGLTDWKSLTVAGNEGFKQACKNEKDTRYFWVQEWGWMVDELKKIQQELLALKGERFLRKSGFHEKDKEESMQGFYRFVDPCPYYPTTTNHEYGWLLNVKPHPCRDPWTIENFGPFPLYPKKARKEFTKKEIRRAIIHLKQRRRKAK